jgi:hypothetical protein
MDTYLFYAPPKEREQRLLQLAEAAEVLRRARTAARTRRRKPKPTRLETGPTFDDAA